MYSEDNSGNLSEFLVKVKYLIPKSRHVNGMYQIFDPRTKSFDPIPLFDAIIQKSQDYWIKLSSYWRGNHCHKSNKCKISKASAVVAKSNVSCLKLPLSSTNQLWYTGSYSFSIVNQSNWTTVGATLKPYTSIQSNVRYLKLPPSPRIPPSPLPSSSLWMPELPPS